MRSLFRALTVALVIVLSGSGGGTSRASAVEHRQGTSVSIDRVFGPLFAQRRVQIDERIVADPYIPTRFRLRWIAPDRLETSFAPGYADSLHVGTVGCVLGNFWVCGLDRVSHAPELRRAVEDMLFPHTFGTGYCCLRDLSVARGAGPHRYVVTATGDPWLFPPGCQGCDAPGTKLPPVTSEHYRAVVTVDTARRPVRLMSRVTIDRLGKIPRRVVPVEVVAFTYGGTWRVELPQGRRFACPRWDRTPGSWCVRK